MCGECSIKLHWLSLAWFFLGDFCAPGFDALLFFPDILTGAWVGLALFGRGTYLVVLLCGAMLWDGPEVLE